MAPISSCIVAIQSPLPPVRPLPPLPKPPSPLHHEKLTLKKEVITRQFGHFGGMFVPEILVHDLGKLESAFRSIYPQETFQKELKSILRDYVGRESPLYYAERLTDHYKHSNGRGGGPQIFLKREDLNHTGAHTINNAVAQALLATRLGKRRIVADTGSGQHGLSVAAVCAKLGLQCVVYMGAKDMEKHGDDVLTMHLMGAEVRAVHSGNALPTDAASEAMSDALTNLESTYHIVGSAVGPHPYPTMVREFQSVIGRETRRQAMEKWGGKPDVLVACVGRGSNAIGLFHEFLDDADVRLVGVEAAGSGLDSGRHAASLAKGEVGVYRGAMSHVLQDHYGQIIRPGSVSAGMVYPCVGPEHSYLKDTGRVEYYSVKDHEAMQAFKRVSRLEGIIPALETCHALAYLEVLCPTLPLGAKVVVNCSGRGDKDLQTAMEYLHDSDQLTVNLSGVANNRVYN